MKKIISLLGILLVMSFGNVYAQYAGGAGGGRASAASLPQPPAAEAPVIQKQTSPSVVHASTPELFSRNKDFLLILLLVICVLIIFLRKERKYGR